MQKSLFANAAANKITRTAQRDLTFIFSELSEIVNSSV